MSQNKVYGILKEIGGEASTSEVRRRLEEKYPDSTLHEYVTNRLRSLEEKDVIEIDKSSRPYYVRIVDEDWEGIPESIANRDFPPKSDDNE
jgi:uncharacterized membrane protein